MRADLMLPYGCRNGACGTCKGKILEGDVDYGPHQASTLTEDEKREGFALFCCAQAADRPRHRGARGAPRRRHPDQAAAVPRRVDRPSPRPTSRSCASSCPPTSGCSILAGQYIDFLLKDGKRRSFSLATPPHDDELLELHIRHVPGGFFTDALFTQYKGREILRFEGPLGSFYLREESDKPIIFVAGGTGFAPIKAMIEHALHHEISDAADGAVLGRALRSQDLYLPELPARWQAEHPHHFTYIPVLSEPAAARTRGRAAPDSCTARCSTISPTCRATRSTPAARPAMIDAARRDFTTARGLPPEEFFADSFTYAAEAEAR